jgi:hypothetical protein
MRDLIKWRDEVRAAIAGIGENTDEVYEAVAERSDCNGYVVDAVLAVTQELIDEIRVSRGKLVMLQDKLTRLSNKKLRARLYKEEKPWTLK